MATARLPVNKFLVKPAQRTQGYLRAVFQGGSSVDRAGTALAFASRISNAPVAIFDSIPSWISHTSEFSFHVIRPASGIAAGYSLAEGIESVAADGFGSVVISDLVAFLDGFSKAGQSYEQVISIFYRSPIHVIAVCGPSSWSASASMMDRLLNDIDLRVAIGDGRAVSVQRTSLPGIPDSAWLTTSNLADRVAKELSIGEPCPIPPPKVVNRFGVDPKAIQDTIALAGQLYGSDWRSAIEVLMASSDDAPRSVDRLTIGGCREIRLNMLGLTAFDVDVWSQKKKEVLDRAGVPSLSDLGDANVQKLADKLWTRINASIHGGMINPELTQPDPAPVQPTQPDPAPVQSTQPDPAPVQSTQPGLELDSWDEDELIDPEDLPF